MLPSQLATSPLERACTRALPFAHRFCYGSPLRAACHHLIAWHHLPVERRSLEPGAHWSAVFRTRLAPWISHCQPSDTLRARSAAHPAATRMTGVARPDVQPQPTSTQASFHRSRVTASNPTIVAKGVAGASAATPLHMLTAHLCRCRCKPGTTPHSAVVMHMHAARACTQRGRTHARSALDVTARARRRGRSSCTLHAVFSGLPPAQCWAVPAAKLRSLRTAHAAALQEVSLKRTGKATTSYFEGCVWE